jgi:uncharacterized membrane protein
MDEHHLKYVPVIGLCVSVYSALFATAILYPWHLELSEKFQAMKEECLFKNMSGFR